MHQNQLPLGSDTQRVHLETLFENIISKHSEDIVERQLSVWFLPSKKTPLVIETDNNLLKLICDELMANAIYHTEQGEVLIVVTPVMSENGEQEFLRFNISDTGVGIPDSMLKKIDSIVHQPNAHRIQNGLVKCSKGVKHIGGKFGVESRMGKGTTFWFEIPLKGLPGRSQPRDQYPLDAVLISEKPVNRMAISRYLAEHCRTVTSVRLMDQLVEKAEQLEAPMVFVDVSVTDINEKTVDYLVKRKVPIFWTGKGNSDITKCLKAISYPVLRQNILAGIKQMVSAPNDHNPSIDIASF